MTVYALLSDPRRQGWAATRPCIVLFSAIISSSAQEKSQKSTFKSQIVSFLQTILFVFGLFSSHSVYYSLSGLPKARDWAFLDHGCWQRGSFGRRVLGQGQGQGPGQGLLPVSWCAVPFWKSISRQPWAPAVGGLVEKPAPYCGEENSLASSSRTRGGWGAGAGR